MTSSNVQKKGGLNKKETPVKTKKNTNKYFFKLFSYAFFLMIISYLAWISWLQKIDLSDYNQKFVALDKKIEINNSLYDSEILLLKKQQNEVLDTTDELNRLSKRVSNLQGQSNESWRIEEVEFLLNIARIKTEVSFDIKSSLNLLRQAQEIIKNLHNSNYFFVRKQIEQDIDVLSSTNIIDRENIWLRLNYILLTISDISLFNSLKFTNNQTNTSKVEVINNEKKINNSLIERFTNCILNGFDFFKEQFLFRRHKAPQLYGILEPKESELLRQNIRFLLMQSQIALLNNDNKIYQTTITEVSNLLSKYFYNDSSEMIDIKTKINQLKLINIDQTCPEATKGLAALYNLKKNHESKFKSEKITENNMLKDNKQAYKITTSEKNDSNSANQTLDKKLDVNELEKSSESKEFVKKKEDDKKPTKQKYIDKQTSTEMLPKSESSKESEKKFNSENTTFFKKFFQRDKKAVTTNSELSL